MARFTLPKMAHGLTVIIIMMTTITTNNSKVMLKKKVEEEVNEVFSILVQMDLTSLLYMLWNCFYWVYSFCLFILLRNSVRTHSFSIVVVM